MVGTDGEEWIFEGWRDGRHTVLTFWSPNDENAQAAYVLGGSFIQLLPKPFALKMARSWAVDEETIARERPGIRDAEATRLIARIKKEQ